MQINTNEKGEVVLTKNKMATIHLEYANYIEPPVPKENLYDTACRSDNMTFQKLGDLWVSNIEANHKKFGSFKDRSIGKLYGKYKYQPAVCAGSGPSLKNNGEELKNRGSIPLLSCLHNFHYFEDRDIPVDFYVSLDAGDVTVEEVYEGGSHDPDWYWERTKGKTLLAYIGSSPKLLEKWQGEILFYNAPAFANGIGERIAAIETFNMYVVSGGNVLGACVYIAKAIMGCNPIAFVGADFSFSYDRKFHSWDSKYDKDLGHVVRTIDVFSNKVYTWNSYYGFKCYFEWLSQTVPGIYINCTEGGTLGAYPDGNILTIKQMDLMMFLGMYHLHEQLEQICGDPAQSLVKVLY